MEIICQAKPLLFIADAKAHKETCNLRGCGGYKCCGTCDNVCKCDPAELEGQDYKVHYATAKPADFKLQTTEGFFQRAYMLMGLHGRISNDKFTALQREFGITFDPASWIFDPYTQNLISRVKGIMWDSMHTLCSSGGVGQYEVNAFVKDLVETTDYTTEQLDEWCNDIVPDKVLPNKSQGVVLWTRLMPM